MKKIIGLLTVLVVGLTLVACNSDDNDGDEVVVRIGVAGQFQDQWDAVNALLEDEGIRVELEFFTDWNIINTALDAGDIDLNAFQNVFFLDNAIETQGYELTPLGYTFITPLNVFAGGRADIEANPERSTLIGYISDGASIGIPADATNGGRALKVLEAAGLIELDPAVGFLGTEADIVYNPFNITIITAEANMLPSLLPDLDAAVINAPQALTNDLSPATDSIFREDAFGLDEMTDALRNVIVARTDEADNPIFARIVEAYQTPEVAYVFEHTFNNAFFPAWE